MPSGEYDDHIKAPTYAGSTPEQRKGLTKWLNLMTGQLELTTKCEEQALLGWQLWWGVAHYISDRWRSVGRVSYNSMLISQI